MSGGDRITRLERRLERERRARIEAEEIAERGMRELWLANQDLESRVEARTVELRRSLLAARQAGQAKEAFLGDLGHDLATPLHAVLGHLELIDRAGLDPDDRVRLDTASANARELAALLKGLVDLAAADGALGPDEIETTDPAQWLDDLVGDWTRRAAGRGQLLVPACRATQPAAAAWGRLRTIAEVLLDNVVTHAHSGQVTLELDVGDDSSGPTEDASTIRSAPVGTVSLTVTDSGPGLDDVELATALEPFMRFGQESGLGIGLARAERLARAAGGSVGLENQGSCTAARVTLPIDHIGRRPATPGS